MLKETQPNERVDLPNVSVWTPDSEETWSVHTYARKAERNGIPVTGYPQWREIEYARNAGGFIPSSGLLYQAEKEIGKKLGVKDDKTPKEMESTATLLRYSKIGDNLAEGLLFNYPILNERGTNLSRDERKIPSASQTFELALPVDTCYVHSIRPELEPFVKVLFGVSDIRILPEDAAIFLNREVIRPGTEIRVIHVNGHYNGRVKIDGLWAPSGRSLAVGFRIFEGEMPINI